MIYFMMATLLVCLFLTIRFGLFLAPKNELTVLMYHQISTDKKDSMNVTASQFERQVGHLKKLGYNAITSQQAINFIQDGTKLPENPVLITFDDGYADNFQLAYPILNKHQMKATIFLQSAVVEETLQHDNGQRYLSVEQLKSMNTDVIEFGLHTHTHCSFRKASLQQIKEELQRNIQFFKENGIPFSPAFAYPYGSRPKCKETRLEMKTVMDSVGVKAAFRIGNRLNKLPLNDIYEIQRMDIRGTDTFWEFKTKLKKRKKINVNIAIGNAIRILKAPKWGFSLRNNLF